MIEQIRLIAAALAFFSAVIFGSAGIIGIFRYHDPYSKLQAGSLCGTTAVFSIFMGAIILSTDFAIGARIVILTFFFLISSPTGTHIIAGFAWNSGIEWKFEKEKDKPDKDSKTDNSDEFKKEDSI